MIAIKKADVIDTLEAPAKKTPDGLRGGTFLRDGDCTSFDELKEMTERLNLTTRRKSVQDWKRKFTDRHVCHTISEDTIFCPLSGSEEERKHHITHTLDLLKKELMQMRIQDQQLAQTLIGLRKEIYKLKLEKSCDEHEEMLIGAHFELEEKDKLAELSDIILPFDSETSEYSSQLKQIGLTPMNIHTRRFSLC